MLLVIPSSTIGLSPKGGSLRSADTPQPRTSIAREKSVHQLGLSVLKPHLEFTEAPLKALEHAKQVKARKIALAKKKAAERARIKAEKERAAVIAAQSVDRNIPLRVSQVYHSEDYYVNWIIQHESGGNPNSVNASSGACGLFQKIPCNVPLGNVSAQMADGLAYIKSRYGTAANAVAFWKSHGWY